MHKGFKFQVSKFKNSKKSEFGVEEALLELVMLGVFIVVAFTIVGRAGSSYFSEQELFGLNSQRFFQSLSFHDGITVTYDSPFLPGAKLGVTGDKKSLDGTITVGVENITAIMKYEYLKKEGVFIGVSADSFPVVITSLKGNVQYAETINNDDKNKNTLPCRDESRPSSIFLASSESMEDFSKSIFRISPERFVGSQPYIIPDPPSAPLKISGDVYLLITNTSDKRLHVSVNSKSSDVESSKKYACYYANIFSKQGLQVIVDYKNPDAEVSDSITLPSNMPSIEISIPSGFTATQNVLSQGGIAS